jgi:2'-5' RNA ligase
MRVFIAIDLPDEVRAELAAVERELRPTTTSARWVAAESIHVTLKFIGETSEKRMESIDEALAGITWKPFQVKVRGLGFFPGKRSPRVLWAGLQAPTMEGLSEKIDSRMERFGFEKEKRAFRPHITLARARHTRLDAALVTAAASLEERNFGSFLVDRCFLYQSTLKSSGAVYSRLKEYLLSPASGVREP